MQRSCAACGTLFEITTDDLAFLEKVSPVFDGKKESIPPPTHCPDCRQQRRLLWRNERSLCRRTCDLCGKSIISMYAKISPFTVYCPECWWSDKWDALSFGRPFDDTQPFFPQFRQLQLQVPRLSVNVVGNENSEYVNLGGYNKNCYLVFAMEYNEDCLYGTEVVKCAGCVDTLNCFESQFCCEVTDVEKCHAISFSRDCSNCADSWFLSDCRNCSDCILCTNLRGKHHYVRNKEVTKETFAREKEEMQRRIRRGGLPQLLEEWAALDRSGIHRAASLVNCEHVSGDYLKNSKNLRQCFDVSYGEDCAYVYTGFKIKDLMDVCHTTEGELTYESLSVGYGSYGALFTHAAWTAKNVLYCDVAQSCGDCFGCAGIRQSRFCILNKQYSKEEYERLVPRIIARMRSTGEYGEFFPASCAPFAYNETNALQYFPLSREDARGRGFGWQDQAEEMPDVARVIHGEKLPSDIAAIPDDVLSWTVQCERTGRLFKIVRRELEFYRERGLPIPHFHPDERHRRRMALRNPRQLWERQCAKCGQKMQSTFAPDRPERVFCESCYLKEVY